MKKFLLVFALAVATLTAHAKLITKVIPYEHDGVKLAGYLAYDDSGKSSRPGILVFSEWWGLNDYSKNRAEALAKIGYVAFAVDMYGAGVVTEDADKARELAGQFYGKPLMAARARVGLDQLVKTGLVDENRLAAIGYCFGGAVCQALAYSGAPVVGIVSFHGGLIPAPVGATQENHTKFLILQGALDPMVSPDDMKGFKQSLDDAKVDYQLTLYAGAVHAFSNPDADRLCAKNGLKGIGYNEPAARRSWQQMEFFFDELFKHRNKDK
jgi:dienelactone hydrolase